MSGCATSEARRVAIVGAGPAGIYAAEALATQQDVPVTVEVIDRMPTPYGLVRYGVAPDHPRIKSVISTLHEVFEHPAVRFLGGVRLGTDISTDDLLRHYDAVLYATGASVDQGLGIPGEDLRGSHAATNFVSWYSGHPDAEQPFTLDDVDAVAVVGVGNVAVDVARLLSKQARDLTKTDLPLPVLEALRRSTVRKVYMLGRRGPEHAKFTSKELRELGELENVRVTLDLADIKTGDIPYVPRAVQSNLNTLRSWAERPVSHAERQLDLNFWSRPVEILGEDRVEALRVERTCLTDQGQLHGTGEYRDLRVQLVLRAVGYRSISLPGVPFDAVRGVVPNLGGRVTDTSGRVRVGEYVAGWLKRGPSGVIGTNRLCAVETVEALLADLRSASAHRRQLETSLERHLIDRNHALVPWAGWLNIDAAEQERGRTNGRDREKIADWATLNSLGHAANE